MGLHMRFTTTTAIALMISGVAAQAQDSSATNDWSGQLSLYGWVPGIKGAQERPDGDPLIDLESSDVLDALEGAFYGTAEFRRDRYGVIIDLAYADLGQDGSAAGTIIPGADPAEASADTTIRMVNALVAYRTYESEGRFFDVYGGLRYYDVDVDFDFKIPSIGFKDGISASASWTDAVIGVRGQMPLGDRFSVTGLVDAGGFGLGDSSDMSWQVLATLDYAFTDRVIGRLGYRYMSIDNETDELNLDVELGGPMIGVTWKF